MKLKDIKGKFRCDNNSHHIFEAKEVRLAEFPVGRFNVFGQTLRGVLSTGEVIGFSTHEPPKKKLFVMCCPVCGAAHLFGFDPVEE